MWSSSWKVGPPNRKLRMPLLFISECDRYATGLAKSWSPRVLTAHDSIQDTAPAGLQVVSSGEIRLRFSPQWARSSKASALVKPPPRKQDTCCNMPLPPPPLLTCSGPPLPWVASMAMTAFNATLRQGQVLKWLCVVMSQIVASLLQLTINGVGVYT